MFELLNFDGLTHFFDKIKTIFVSKDELANKMDKENPTGTGSFSMNRKADTTIGENSTTEGNGCEASGFSSHAEGNNTIASGDYSHAEGSRYSSYIKLTGSANATTYTVDDANGNFIQVGNILYYNSKYATITDYNRGTDVITVDSTLSSSYLNSKTVYYYMGIASGENSHSEGFGTIASGISSHAEGEKTIAFGERSHAEGWITFAYGRGSHAEGNENVASGHYSHVEGLMNDATGFASHAEGGSTIAASSYQHVQGHYNIKDAEGVYAHIVGNGENLGEESNAHTLDWDGNAEFAGDVVANGCGGENPVSILGLNSNKADKTNPTLTWNLNTDTDYEVVYQLRPTGNTGTQGLGLVRNINGSTTFLINTPTDGSVVVNGVTINSNNDVVFSNAKGIRCKRTDGSLLYALNVSSSNNLVIGDSTATSGDVNIYSGGDVRMINGADQKVTFQNSGYFIPGTDNTIGLGKASYKWTKVYATAGTIATSDERLKHDIISISELPVSFTSEGENALEMLFDKLIPKVFYLNSDEDEKIQIGFVAQDISKSLEEIGMSENDMALIDHEYWTDEETREEKDEYGVIYSQFIALNTHMIQKLRKENEELKERLTKIEAMLNIE